VLGQDVSDTQAMARAATYQSSISRQAFFIGMLITVIAGILALALPKPG